MSIERTRRVMQVFRLLSLMPMGEGWAKPLEIVQWSGVTHATVYRYLPKLEKLGYLHIEEYKCRKLTCKRYRITEKGLNWVMGLDVPF